MPRVKTEDRTRRSPSSTARPGELLLLMSLETWRVLYGGRKRRQGGLLATMRAGIGFLKSNHQNARERAPETVGEGRSGTNTEVG